MAKKTITRKFRKSTKRRKNLRKSKKVGGYVYRPLLYAPYGGDVNANVNVGYAGGVNVHANHY